MSCLNILLPGFFANILVFCLDFSSVMLRFNFALNSDIYFSYLSRISSRSFTTFLNFAANFLNLSLYFEARLLLPCSETSLSVLTTTLVCFQICTSHRLVLTSLILTIVFHIPFFNKLLNLVYIYRQQR